MFEFLQTAQFFTGFNVSDLTFLAEAAGRTLLISALSISIGTVLGCGFGWLLAVGRWAGAATLGLILDAFRSVPLIIQLILFFNLFPIIGFPVNPFAAGTFVLVLYTSALVAAVAAVLVPKEGDPGSAVGMAEVVIGEVATVVDDPDHDT